MPDLLISRVSLISEAIIRVAAAVRRPALRSRLEESAMALLESVSTEDFDIALKHLGALKAFVNLSAAIYELETINKKILMGELESLGASIDKLGKSDFSANIGDLFKIKATLPIADESAIQSAIGNEPVKQLPIELPIENDLPPAYSGADSVADEDIKETNAMVSIATAIRQSAIVEKIRALSVRDSGGEMTGCKMKDLLATFPDVSERTLRNDLQRLLNRGSIERIGTGGATSAYVIK